MAAAKPEYITYLLQELEKERAVYLTQKTYMTICEIMK